MPTLVDDQLIVDDFIQITNYLDGLLSPHPSGRSWFILYLVYFVVQLNFKNSGMPCYLRILT